jgi:antitoxin component YwqK of YwqJK toxin-antitoxin module
MKKWSSIFIILFILTYFTVNQGQCQFKSIPKAMHVKSGDSLYLIQTIKKSITPKENSIYYCFKSLKILQVQGGYVGALLSGDFTLFCNDIIIQKGNFKKGLKDGIWIEWWPSGLIKESITWKNGVMSGRFIKNDASGLHVVSGNYKNGQYNGEIIRGKNKDLIRYYSEGKEIERKKKFRIPFVIFETKERVKKVK